MAAKIETDMIQDKDKRDEIERKFMEYIKRKNIFPDQEGRYLDPTYGFFITPSILEARIQIIKPKIFIPPGARQPSFLSPAVSAS